jgi:hypothetical protein
MTHDDIIRLAREAAEATNTIVPPEGPLFVTPFIERFAALVAAAERERMDLNAIHSCHAECQNPFCIRVREAVAHEREQCALIAESYEPRCDTCPSGVTNAIRARGNTGIKWEIEP